MKLKHLTSFFFAKKPTQAAFFLTLQCNSRCSWCNAWQQPKGDKLTLPQIKKIFGKLKSFGIKLLYLSGGEPLLRPDFLAIVKLAQKFGFDMILATNGILLDGRLIHHLVKIPSLRINVSLDSLDKDLYQKIRGVDALDRVLKNLLLFKNLYPRYPIRVTMTISQANLNQAEKVYQFCQKNRLYFSPNPYFELGRFRQNNPLHDYHQSIKSLISYYQNIMQRVKIDTYVSGLPLVYEKLILWLEGKMTDPCGAGEELLYVDPKGLVYACQDLKPFADLKKDNLAKIWEEKKWLPAVKKCYKKTPCFIFCTRSPYLIKHHKIRIIYDLLTSKKLLHYFKMY